MKIHLASRYFAIITIALVQHLHGDLRTDFRSIGNFQEWESRRGMILQNMEKAMGPLPSHAQPGSKVDLDVREDLTKTVSNRFFFRRTISFASGDAGGDRVHAHIYLPADLKPHEKRPGVLALHPTSHLGKAIVAGDGPLPNRNYAVELSMRGYIVIAPDYPSFGESKDYNFDTDEYVSGTMKGIVNHIRCVDFLESMDEVDSDRLGVIGHSLGGHNAMFAGVFDQRLKVVVSSCGWTTFHDYYQGDIAGWTSDRYMPALRNEFGLDPDKVPFDFHEVIAALAPRPFFSNSPLRDSNFEVAGVMKASSAAKRIYGIYGHEDRLRVRHPDAGHDFPPPIRKEAYDFMDKALGHFPSMEVPKVEPGSETHLDHGLDGTFTGPWSPDLYRIPPKARWLATRDPKVMQVFYEGPTFGGSPTEVFAYLARPGRGTGPFPGILLVHGGGGKAFEEWARLWADRGYVALAMDTAGQGPDGQRHTLAGPSQDDGSKFRHYDREQIKDMWTYHAVAAVLKGHALLANLSEVDADRIGITGISWGGYLTCIVAGIDPGIKVAVPVYGCGFLHLNSVWLEPRLSKMSAELRENWIAHFDPSRYLAGVRCPILFMNGTNDFAYPMDSYKKSYLMVPGHFDLCVRVRMPHGHPQGWEPLEIGYFVDSVLAGGNPPVRMSPPSTKGLQDTGAGKFVQAWSEIHDSQIITEAQVHYTLDQGPWSQRLWQSQTAERSTEDGRQTFSAVFPSDRRVVFFFSVKDQRGAYSSSEHFEWIPTE